MWISAFHLEGESFRDVGAFSLNTTCLHAHKKEDKTSSSSEKKKNNASVLSNLCNQEAGFFFFFLVPARILEAPERLAIVVIMEKWKH